MATSLYVEHLSQKELQTLTEYKYRGEDRSITYKYIMGPFYNRLIHVVPMWIAPNAITFIGFILAISGHALLMYHSPQFETQAPSWVYVYSGVALTVYMILDNLDGKQARRTQSSSPLGHLFDHGCDALNVTLSGMSVMATIQLGAGWMSMTLLSSLGHMMVFAATLEEYFTGAMILRVFNGPNEGLITLCILQIVTGIVGPSVWTKVITLPFTGGLTMQLNHFTYYVGIVPTLNSVVGNAFGVLQFLRRERGGLAGAANRLLSHAFPIMAAWVCFNGWAVLAPEQFRRQLLYILWMSALLVFDLISRMILAHLAQAPYPFLPKLFIPVSLCSVNAMLYGQIGFCFVDVDQATILTLGLLVVYNSWRVWCLIAQLCDFLNVRCFSLRKLRN